MVKKPRPDRLEQILTVSRPHVALLGRVMSRFAGLWQLNHFRLNQVPVGKRVCYRLELVWRSDVSQYARLIDPATMTLKPKAELKLYDDISRLDRLRLWLLTVESWLRGGGKRVET